MCIIWKLQPPSTSHSCPLLAVASVSREEAQIRRRRSSSQPPTTSTRIQWIRSLATRDTIVILVLIVCQIWDVKKKSQRIHRLYTSHVVDVSKVKRKGSHDSTCRHHRSLSTWLHGPCNHKLPLMLLLELYTGGEKIRRGEDTSHNGSMAFVTTNHWWPPICATMNCWSLESGTMSPEI